MQSRTSCFNKTVFKKNLTRFAPVWVLYTICLILGLFLLYTERTTQRDYWFVRSMAELISVMGPINLCYALVVAQLLFGDLYNSRMCNMLHAMPLRRESWFVTNVLSGLTFSVMPTAIMTVVSMPLLMGGMFKDAWQIGLLLFAGSNLEYLCFFGLAVFAAMCVGNRFTMAAGYGLLNAGAYIFYWLVDTVYTPMLYGIITPTTLATNLTPIAHMVEFTFLEVDSRSALIELFGENLEGAVANFTVTGEWWRLLVWAGVGIAFAAAALVLYRKRDLECAGDAVAFRPLVPVFQVLCAIFVMTAGQFFLYSFLGLGAQNYVVLSAGLFIGWFIGKMLIERSTRVFRLKNWYGLFALAGVLVVTLVCTHFDVLQLEERMPKLEKIEKVYFETSYTSGYYLEEEADIQAMMQLHRLALEDRVESPGAYVLGTNGEWVRNVDTYADVIDEEAENPQYRYVADIGLRYELKNGNTVRRRYNVWVESPAGEIANEYLNDWDRSINDLEIVTEDGTIFKRLDMVLDTFETFNIDYFQNDVPETLKTREAAESFVAAVKADCEAGNMAQHPYFHTGHFRVYNKAYEKGYTETDRIWVNLEGKKYGWSVEVYPDSENTLGWLMDHGLVPELEVRPESRGYY